HPSSLRLPASPPTLPTRRSSDLGPEALAALTTFLFAQDGDVGRGPLQVGADGVLAGAVGFRHPVSDALGLGVAAEPRGGGGTEDDRKSTRLNSSHGSISSAVFCL